jgi:hypothetical protein
MFNGILHVAGSIRNSNASCELGKKIHSVCPRKYISLGIVFIGAYLGSIDHKNEIKGAETSQFAGKISNLYSMRIISLIVKSLAHGLGIEPGNCNYPLSSHTPSWYYR